MEIICPTLTTYEIELPEPATPSEVVTHRPEPIPETGLELAYVEPDAPSTSVDIELIESCLTRYFDAD